MVLFDKDMEIGRELPLLAVRDVVIFTDMILPLFIGRDMSLGAVEAALAGSKQLFIAAQKVLSQDSPAPEDLYQIGTVALVVRQGRMPDGRLRILIQGLAKARITEVLAREPYLKVRLELIEDYPSPPATVELEALMRTVREKSQKIMSLRDLLNDEIVSLLDSLDSPGRLADLVISNLQIKVGEAQKILEILDPGERLTQVNEILNQELKVSLMQAKIDSDTREEMDRSQREFYLREQMRAIKKELGDDVSRDDETLEYRTRIKNARLPKQAASEVARQLSRLEWMHPDAAEAAVIRSYLDWIVELPWSVATRDKLDLKEAKKVLDSDHYNLKKVKDRILEYLAVMKLNRRQKGSIICFLGPPGVGKTSLGQSIARAMGRKFVRFSLGGLKDEAEIRGHRRTYIGALPGRIIQGLKTAGTNNPVFMLDEVDKIGSDFRGDPASALLEVLDPEQNSNFSDHYLNLPFDLSNVMFITTANFLDSIPQALEDRMEVIYLSGYTAEEKVAIAKKHLLPRLIRDHGLKSDDLTIQDSAISQVISGYTQEAGLRGLDRKLAAICRKVARKVAEGESRPHRITKNQLIKFLGPPEVLPEPSLKEGLTGVVTGLAWTETGGEIMYIEVRTMLGKGNLSLTGQLGEIMKESAQTVMAYIRTHAREYGLAKDFFDSLDIHVHLPAGAVPKEGPSAGVTLMSAILSALIDQPAPRDLAMTGEITLRGQVLAIGGLKEKALAALRAGISKIIIPKQNLKDLEDLPPAVKKQLEFLPVDNIEELLAIVFPQARFQVSQPPAPPLPLPRPRPRSRPRRRVPPPAL
ncbi:MAG: endopeptidase La [Deltaproteobacteria bacterium]|jgi:ATP-dependent Lon protease|nr:endopeptidase La [Deltaproteobacteria bacterium]